MLGNFSVTGKEIVMNHSLSEKFDSQQWITINLTVQHRLTLVTKIAC